LSYFRLFDCQTCLPTAGNNLERKPMLSGIELLPLI